MPALVASVLDRLLSPIAGQLTTKAAERVTKFRIDSKTQAKVDKLAEKANEGLLTESERAEYLAFIEAMDAITIFKSKTRRALLRRKAHMRVK
jgi:hypothetical protein